MNCLNSKAVIHFDAGWCLHKTSLPKVYIYYSDKKYILKGLEGKATSCVLVCRVMQTDIYHLPSLGFLICESARLNDSLLLCYAFQLHWASF